MFKKGQKPPEGSGRKPGVPNKVSTAARQVIADTATKLGGAERLYKWCKESKKNEFAFWTRIYPRLLPVEVHGGGEGGAFILKVTEAESRL